MKVLFIDTTHPVLREMLESPGWTCDYFPELNRQELMDIAHQYQGFVLRSRIEIDEEILEKSTSLKFIARVGAGMESIDTEAAEKRGIRCFNSPEGNRDAVGEHATGMLLSLMNNLTTASNQIKNGGWLREENRGSEIAGKTVGIIGYGNMGTAFAEKISGFGARVIAYDKYKSNYGDAHAEACNLNSIFEHSDIVSLHVPLTGETRYMANHHFFAKFRKKIWLINTARGPVVQTEALVAALNSGKVKGAALDVIEYEETSFEKLDINSLPASFQALRKMDNVLFTPHIAGWTHESKRKLAEVLAGKILAEFSQ
jgi:D-3-phosphoglycerate dehydrogenase